MNLYIMHHFFDGGVVHYFLVQSIPLDRDTSGLAHFVPIKRLVQLSEVPQKFQN